MPTAVDGLTAVQRIARRIDARLVPVVDRLRGMPWHKVERYAHPAQPGVDIIKCVRCGHRGTAPSSWASDDPRVRYTCRVGTRRRNVRR